MLSDVQHTNANVRNAADLTVLDTASRHTANSDRIPLHFITRQLRCKLSNPMVLMLDMALMSSMSVLGSSNTLINDCYYMERSSSV